MPLKSRLPESCRPPAPRWNRQGHSRSGRTRISRSGGGIEPAIAPLSADLVKRPPTKILPSACTVIESTRTTSFTPSARVEGDVERAVRIQPGDVVARDRYSADGESVKICHRQDLSVSLHRDRIDPTVRARIECDVERAIRIAPCDVVACNTQTREKAPADDDLAVWLNGGLGGQRADRGAEI